MSNLLPWVAVVGIGALHGLNPATGWMFAAACGVRARDAAQVRRALLPIAIGHAVSVAVVASVFALGMSMDRTQVQGFAGALLMGAAAYRLLRGAGQRKHISGRAGHAGIALCSFLMTTAHGAGLMLVPALVPICLSDNVAREITASGSMVLALAAVGVHMAAMLATTGIIATAACRGIAMHPSLLRGTAPRQAWTAALAASGVLLIALR